MFSAYDIIIYGPYLKRTQLLCVIWRYRLWAASPSFIFHQRGVRYWKFEILRIRLFNLNIRYMATSKQTYTRVLQCCPASVGLTQARPNNIGVDVDKYTGWDSKAYPA